MTRECYQRTFVPSDTRGVTKAASFVSEAVRRLLPEVVIVTVKTSAQHQRELEYQRELERRCQPSLFDAVAAASPALDVRRDAGTSAG